MWAYFAHSDQAVKASGLISGSSSALPKVMLSPERARTTKQVAVIQCTNRSSALKRTIVRPERPLSIRTMPRDKIEDDEQRQHAEDGDGADPAQRHLVEMAPVAARRLLDRVGFDVGDAAATLDRLELLQQLLLA